MQAWPGGLVMDRRRKTKVTEELSRVEGPQTVATSNSSESRI